MQNKADSLMIKTSPSLPDIGSNLDKIEVPNTRHYWSKRLIDITICLMALPVVLPIALLIALLIKLDTPGPIFFTQIRVGRKGRTFTIIKFRTMQHNCDDQRYRDYMTGYIRGHITKSKRNFKPPISHLVTRMGRLLRKTSLDELPQIFNVLKGEMSLVGPRPHVPWEVAAYADWHTERLQVLPGITGLAQINGRSELLFDRLVEYDLEYIRRQSLRNDLQILWRTIHIVLKQNGAG